MIPGVAHIYAMFTDPARWRRESGAACRLGRAEMASAGYEWARLWTPRDAPARAFYRHAAGPGRSGPLGADLRLDLVGYEKKLSR